MMLGFLGAVILAAFAWGFGLGVVDAIRTRRQN